MDHSLSDGRQHEDHDGFLQEMTHWTREIAEDMARRNNLGPLSDDHWKVIEFVKAYYQETGESPPVVRIGKALGLSSKRICELFPCGVARGAYRLAGLPRPFGCL